MNPEIGAAINQFHVEHDPYGFVEDSNWLLNAAKVENILQLGHVYGDGPIIDVGFYGEFYRAVVIRDLDWERPVEQFESDDPAEINRWLLVAIDRYANGF